MMEVSKNKLVLVAHGDDRVRAAIADALKKSGLRIVTAGDGFEAIEIMKRERPDLVSLDLVMPGHSGMKLFNALKRNKEWRGIPVIITTGTAVVKDGGIDLSGLTLSGPGIYLERIDGIDGYADVVCWALGAEGVPEKEKKADLLRHEIVAALDNAQIIRDIISHTIEDADASLLMGVLSAMRNCPFHIKAANFFDDLAGSSAAGTGSSPAMADR